MTARPDFVLQTFIRCTQDALWEALTDPDLMARYHFMATKVTRDGDLFSLYHANGDPMFEMRMLEIDPKSRIVTTFEPQWEGGGAPSRTIYLIRAEGDHCALTLEHYDLTFEVVPGEGVADGWARWAASLKTFLETGAPMRLLGPGEAAAEHG